MAVAIPKPLPRVTAYDDYRAFLRDWYAARKAQEPGFSYAVFARRAGLASRAHFQGVATGRLNLGPEGVERFAKGLRLSREATEYFALLVAFNQERRARERKECEAAVRAWLWSYRGQQLPERRFGLLIARKSRMLVFCLTSLRGFRADAAWISRKLDGRISPAEAREALDFLRTHGYIRVSGRRLLWTDAESAFALEGEEDPLSRQWARQVYRQASDLRTRPVDSLYTLHAVLTPAEARDLAAKLRERAGESFPKRRGKRYAGKLHMLLVDVVQLSR